MMEQDHHWVRCPGEGTGPKVSGLAASTHEPAPMLSRPTSRAPDRGPHKAAEA